MSIEEAVEAVGDSPIQDLEVGHELSDAEMRLLYYEQWRYSANTPFILVFMDGKLDYYGYIEELHRSMRPELNGAGQAANQLFADLTVLRMREGMMGRIQP